MAPSFRREPQHGHLGLVFINYNLVIHCTSKIVFCKYFSSDNSDFDCKSIMINDKFFFLQVSFIFFDVIFHEPF